MDYLLEIHWSDPIADAVARILYSAPESVELMTGHVPQGRSRAFVVYRSDSFEILEGLAHAMSNLGARVRVTSAANGTGKLHEGPGDGTGVGGVGTSLGDGGVTPGHEEGKTLGI